MPETKGLEDYTESEMRGWAAHDITLAFRKHLRELREASVLRLIAASQARANEAQIPVMGGQIDVFDVLLAILEA